MKTILISFKGFENNTIFTIENSNDSNGPWKLLKNKLADLGYNLKTVDDHDLQEAERIIFFDEVSLGLVKREKPGIKKLIKTILRKSNAPTQRQTYEEAIRYGLKEKLILILWETSAIDPDNYTQETYDRFSTILTWKDDLVDNKKFFKYLHPYPIRGTRKEIPWGDKKILVNISMNKISHEKNELYSERRKSIAFFEKALGEQFDLFGYGWNKPATRLEKFFPFLVQKYKSYRGTCDDKLEVLSKYKFSLCYENIQKENGWITEKIFDCFNAKTVPIYWGAENVTTYIPPNTFIDRRKFKTENDLLIFLENMTEKQYAEYMDAIDAFLNSPVYKQFLPEAFVDIVIRTLNLK